MVCLYGGCDVDGRYGCGNGGQNKQADYQININQTHTYITTIDTGETKYGRTFTIDMHRDSVLIFDYELTINEIVFTEGKGRLENLYNACSMFVDWYNNQKTLNCTFH